MAGLGILVRTLQKRGIPEERIRKTVDMGLWTDEKIEQEIKKLFSGNMGKLISELGELLKGVEKEWKN